MLYVVFSLLGIHVESQVRTAKGRIDVIIDRADRVINLCEIKFSQEPYVITKEYAQKVRNRAALFREESRTKKSFAITFITTFGIAQNIHAGLAQNELTAEALFR